MITLPVEIWYWILKCQQLSKIVNLYRTPINWNWQNITESIFLKQINKVQYIKNVKVNIQVIRLLVNNNLSSKIDWSGISFKQELSEDFIREFKDKVDWRYISCCQELSENCIREFQDKVDWSGISFKQELSEDFIRKFKDKVDWRYISCCQKIIPVNNIIVEAATTL